MSGSSSQHGGNGHVPLAKERTVSDSTNNANKNAELEDPKPKPSVLARVGSLWSKTGIDKRTAMSMFKGALAPTISLAAYQADAWADFYTTLGYLVIIMTILPVVIMPRAKFLQTMIVNVLFACIGAALALLAMFCSVKARINSIGFQGAGTGGAGTSGTPSTGASTANYNSSGSAVAGVWLFVMIYIISVIRAKMPQYTVPCILWAVFANVSMTYAPQFSTMAQAEAFIQKLLLAFLSGFGVAVGVSLLVFPLTSRQVVFKEMTGYIAALRECLQANLQYVHSLEETDMFAAQRTNTAGEKPPRSKEAEAFKAKVQGLAGLHAKLSTDLPFAKREVALGKLGPDDLQELYKIFRLIMVPTVGLSSMSDIFDRISTEAGWDPKSNFANATIEDASNTSERNRIQAINEWHELMRLLREPFNSITETIDQGLQHVQLVLQLVPRPKKSGNANEEASTGLPPSPGDKGFAAYFERKSREFSESKKIMLRGWCNIHDIDLPKDFFENPECDFRAPEWLQWTREGELSPDQSRLRRQLFLGLYIEFLLLNVSRQTSGLIATVDRFEAHGKLTRTRLIVPGFKRLRKWFLSLLRDTEDAHADQDMHTEGNSVVYLGDAYKKRRDPEHLPPANIWEHFGNQFRKIAHFFRSPASAFGFRCACATFSIAVINYLEPTQTFFTTQRLFWAQIMVSISMSPTAGQSLWNFVLRLVGTALAMIMSWIAWYIVDGQTAGVIVFFFVFLHAYIWLMLKHPQYMPIGMIGQVTVGLILGYELQVRKVGVAVATSNGQAYWPIYILGPIRLGTVFAGLFVAWVWTIFPYPISEHNQIRKSLGSSLYLMANYYSVMHETVRLRLSNLEGDMTSKDSPGRKLEKARSKVYTKTSLSISGIRAQTGFLSFDIPIGGRFPREQYQKLVAQLQTVLNFMSLISLASSTFTELREEGEKEHGSKWLAEFAKIVGKAHTTSEQITTLLSLMSASVNTGQPLPPYIRVPEPSVLSEKLDEMDKDILSIRHIAEPGYASFVVIHLGTRFVHNDLKQVVAGIKELVGELDFHYHVVSTTDPDRNESEETLVYTRTNTVGDSRRKMD